jgi:hypothetical protein
VLCPFQEVCDALARYAVAEGLAALADNEDDTLPFVGIASDLETF